MFQALGAGARDLTDNELIESPEEEEEFDLLNNETFGDNEEGQNCFTLSLFEIVCVIWDALQQSIR